MSGAGAFGAGVGPAGFSPVAAPSATSVSTPPRATRFDPSTRDWSTTAGYYDAVHPYDQQVVLALVIQQGTVGSNPELGAAWHEIKRAGGADLESRVDDIVRRALARLTDAKKITISAIQVDASIRGQVRVAVSYVNNFTKKVVTTAVSVTKSG